MNNWLAEWGARSILASRQIDRAYRFFDKFRSELVLAVASDAVLDRFNDLSYGETESYRPDSQEFRAYLFPWEEQVVEQFLPPPPARILLGGAGGGREVFALAKKGYQIVAFEPSKALVESMVTRIAAEGAPVEVFQASYEDLPQLTALHAETEKTNLEDLKPFDAAIVGWGSFSHLRTQENRIHALQAFANVTQGPIVVSFLSFGGGAHASRLRRLLPGRFNQDSGNAFSAYIGFYHEMNEAEITAIAAQAQLKIIHLNTDSRDTNWPHAVLKPDSLLMSNSSLCQQENP